MEYTKGEWKASHPLGGISFIVAPEKTLCKIEWGTTIIESEQRANAHLIAAALDLYEALSELIQYINDEYGLAAGQFDGYIKSKQALSKAEGN